VVARIGSTPTTPDEGEPDRAHREAASGQGERRHAAARVGGHDEVRRGAEHRRERPQHAVQGQIGARQEVQDEHEPHGGEGRARQRQAGRTLAAAEPQPHDDGGGGGVLDEQCRSDVHRRDGGEVRELRSGHRHRAVEQDEAQVAPQQHPASAQGSRRERRDDERRDADAGEHDRPGAPAGIDQPAGQGPRERERRGGDQGEGQPGSCVHRARCHERSTSSRMTLGGSA
jgi:hypothetical protein